MWDLEDIKKYTAAMNFASIRHQKQRRHNKDKTPYINHPIGVANMLANEGDITDLNTLMGALLHDTVEDTETTFDEIEDNFGKVIRKIVEEVSDNKALPKEERKRLQVEHAASCSPEAKLIKLADKLYNLRDLSSPAGVPEGWSQQRINEYFIWAKEVIDNLRGTNSKLEASLDEVFYAHNKTQEG